MKRDAGQKLRQSEFETSSGIEIDTVYTPDDANLAATYDENLPIPAHCPLPVASSPPCIVASYGPSPAVRRIRHRGADQRAFPLSALPGTDRPLLRLRPADPDGAIRTTRWWR